MTALALRDDQNEWDERQLAALRGSGIDEDVTEAELMTFLHECQRRKLDPFSRQIYLIGRKDKSKGRKVYRSQTSIDGFRLIARRAADRSGTGYSYEDTIWYDAKGGRHEVWLSQDAPAAAKVVVIRNGARFDAVARFGAYVQTGYEGKPLKMWESMPDVMIAKCAEALALRKAFPEDLGGLYTDDEMAQADNPQPVTAVAEVVRDEPANGNGSWYRTGLKRAQGPFKSDAEGIRLWQEAGERQLNGEITPKQRDEIQNTVTKRIGERRLAAATRILKPLAEDDPWRVKILEELDGNDLYGARTALEELQQQVAAGTMPDDRKELLGRAIIARFPKAGLAEGGSDGSA